MTARPLRLFHASDFRLDSPCVAAPGLPKSLLDLFVDARYRAVTKLVTTCIERKVDVLLLAGGLLDPELTGLRGPWHLVEQFSRLQDAGIDVVWCGSHVDAPHRWPAYVGLPANVRRFSPSARTPVTIRRPGTVPLFVCGVHATSQSAVPNGAFRVMLAPKGSEPTVHSEYDYLAGGGRTEGHIAPGQSAAWPGSPQGRSADEPGPHGGLLIIVAADRSKTIEPIATDVIRWHRIERTLTTESRFDDVTRGLKTELALLDHPVSTCEAHIAAVTIDGDGLAATRFRSASRRIELTDEIRASLESVAPPVWLSRIAVRPEERAAATDPDLLVEVAATEATIANATAPTADRIA